MFRVASCVHRETTEEGLRTFRPNRSEYSNKDEDNSPHALNDKNMNLIMIIYIYISKVGDQGRRWPEVSLFDSYYTEEKALHLSLECSTLPFIRTL